MQAKWNNKTKIRNLCKLHRVQCFLWKSLQGSRDVTIFIFYAQYFPFNIILLFFKGNNSKQHIKILLTLNQSYHVNIITNMVWNIFAVNFLCLISLFLTTFCSISMEVLRFPSRQFAGLFVVVVVYSLVFFIDWGYDLMRVHWFACLVFFFIFTLFYESSQKPIISIRKDYTLCVKINLNLVENKLQSQQLYTETKRERERERNCTRLPH